MQRTGHIIVSEEHPVFPDEVARKILSDADIIVESIERQFGVRIPPIGVEIVTHLTTRNQDANMVLRNGFSKPRLGVRFILTSNSVNPDVLVRSIKDDQLLVLFEDFKFEHILLSDVPRPATVRIHQPPSWAVRGISDLLVDLRLGHFFSSREPLSGVVQSEGHVGLFARKAAHARRHRPAHIIVDRDARYAILSALTDAAAGDYGKRAADAYGAWFEFSRSASLSSRAGSATIPLRLMPKLGGQLPVAKLERVASALPDGHYVIAVLNRSTVRKSAKLKDKVYSCFGRRARRGKVVFFPSEKFSPLSPTLLELEREGYAAIIGCIVRDGVLLSDATEE